MRYWIGTNYRSCTLKIDIEAKKQCQINLIVEDSKQANTVFTRRTREFAQGERQTLHVQMPMTGKAVIITLFEGNAGPDSKLTMFSASGMKLLPLVKQINVIDILNANVRAFIPFLREVLF